MVHDIPGLIRYRGGNLKFIESLDDHFNGGHNDHSNEVRVDFQLVQILHVIIQIFIIHHSQPSHHIPYLYSLAGAAYKSQEKVREIARENYNNTPIGLSGVRVFSSSSSLVVLWKKPPL